MQTTIENGILSVSAKTAGAELTSIRLKADGTEYLWQADPKFWNRHAPLLFPIVGALNGVGALGEDWVNKVTSALPGQDELARKLLAVALHKAEAARAAAELVQGLAGRG
jgi:hypothetical protein